MQVVNLTTPTQYFHLLRKQALQKIKKPLVIMTPKSLLRHPKAVSNVEELANGAFRPFIEDPKGSNEESANRLILCSGKVYYDLLISKEDHNIVNVIIAIVDMHYVFSNLYLNLYPLWLYTVY